MGKSKNEDRLFGDPVRLWSDKELEKMLRKAQGKLDKLERWRREGRDVDEDRMLKHQAKVGDIGREMARRKDKRDAKAKKKEGEME